MALEEKKLLTSKGYLNLQDVEVYYERYDHPNPKGTLLLIHGFLSSALSFQSLTPLLTQNYSVVVFELPGFGRSEKSLRFYYSYENYGRLTIELIKKMQLPKVILVGHSMGGQIALQAAKQQPSLIQDLVLISPSGYLRRARRAAIYCAYLPFFPWIIKQVYKRKDVHKSFSRVVFDQSLINDEMINSYLEPFYEKNFFPCLARLFRQREGDLSSEELRSITVPTLLLWGNEDVVTPLSIGKRLANDLPNCRLATISQAGHLLCEEHPEKVYQLICNENIG